MVTVSPFSALSNLGQTTGSGINIAQNFDTFLSLLTTQLQNQNPLDPLDMNQFTQQLVQFTEVEQSLKLNENLAKVVQLTAANTITNAVGYIGREVTTNGTSAELQGGVAKWTYKASADSLSAKFTVTNTSGQPVYTQTVPISAGTNVFTWNGQTDAGGTAPAGVYTLALAATDANGKAVETTTGFSGIVDGVDMSGTEPVLSIGTRRIRLQDIVAIKAAGAS